MAKKCRCIPGSVLCKEAERLWKEYLMAPWPEGREIRHKYARHVGYRKPCGCTVAERITFCHEAQQLYQKMLQAARVMDRLQKSLGSTHPKAKAAWRRWSEARARYNAHLKYNPDTDTDVDE